MGEPSSLSPSSRMGLASISWNSVRVFSKLRTGLFRVLYQGTRFGTVRRIAYAHSIVGTPGSGTPISYALSFRLEAVEVVAFAYILIFLCDRYTSGSKQLPVLL